MYSVLGLSSFRSCEVLLGGMRYLRGTMKYYEVY